MSFVVEITEFLITCSSSTTVCTVCVCGGGGRLRYFTSHTIFVTKVLFHLSVV